MKENVTTIGRAGKLSLQVVANYAGRPGAEAEAKAVSAELMKVASNTNFPRPVRGEILYLVGLIGGPESGPRSDRKLLEDRVVPRRRTHRPRAHTR